MGEVKWIKITTNIFDDEKIRVIETMPEGDTIIVIWFKLLCLAGKSNSNGYFMLNDQIAYTDDMLVAMLNRPVRIVKLALETFMMYGMIELVDNILCLPNWEKHQNIEGLEKLKLQNKERQQRYRDKQKNLRIENKEIDKDKELDIENVRDSNATVTLRKEETIYSIAKAYTDDDVLYELIIEFTKHRTKLKKPMTVRALKGILSKLDSLDSVEAKIYELDNSITNGWQSVCYENADKNKRETWVNEYRSARREKEKKDYDKAITNLNDSDYDEIRKKFFDL